MSRQRMIVGALACAIAAFPFCAAGAGKVRAAELTPAAQTSNQGGVKITVAPPGFQSDAKTWDFAITLETHAQPLDDDLARTSTLLADGKSYLPMAWRGDPPGGHHRKGMLRFYAVVPRPQAVELQIHRAGETAPRVFRWQLGSRP